MDDVTEGPQRALAEDMETAQLLRRARSIVLEVCGECPHSLVGEVFRRLDGLQLERAGADAGTAFRESTWH